MGGSANQGRDSIYKLVEEDEIADLLDYGHREGMTGRQIIYEEDSTRAWLSAEYCLDPGEFR
jgi:hypothetical protein